MPLTKTLDPSGVLVEVNGKTLDNPQVTEDIVDQVALLLTEQMVFGNGVDGPIAVADGATTTLTKNTYATTVNIGVGSTLDTDGYWLFSSQGIVFADATGVIKSKTGLPGSAGTGGAAGAGAPSQTATNSNIRPGTVTFTGAAGSAGGAPGANAGVAGANGLYNISAVTGAAGGAGTGAAGGAGGTPTDFWYPFKGWFNSPFRLLFSLGGVYNNLQTSVLTGGAGGGGGGTGAGGGGGGGHAYSLMVVARSITGGGILRTVGGAGGAGFDNGGTGRGGGGGGGTAGLVLVITKEGETASYVHSSLGGAGGAAGGAGASAGADGSSAGYLVALTV